MYVYDTGKIQLSSSLGTPTTDNILIILVFNALSIGTGRVTAVLLCTKRGRFN